MFPEDVAGTDDDCAARKVASQQSKQIVIRSFRRMVIKREASIVSETPGMPSGTGLTSLF
jgi:hypothetical protein